MSKVDDAALKANRAIGVVHLNEHNLQVVIGPQVQSVKDELDSLDSGSASCCGPAGSVKCLIFPPRSIGTVLLVHAMGLHR